jgi:VanZ family protein
LPFIAYAPALVWAAFLLFLGGRSDVPSFDTPLPIDKAAHFGLYGLLGALAALGWVRVRRPAWFWPVAFALLVGAVDEIHQRAVPNRSSDALDWVADAAGIGGAFAFVVRRKTGKGSTA